MSNLKTNVPFPVDAVYLWVDGNDPQWLARKNEIVSNSYDKKNIRLREDVISKGRFIDNGELRYSLRSIALYAPWIRKVYLVTDNQCPKWINRDKIKIIDHKEIFPSFAARPCFSTRAIELCVHRIKDLSEHYLLFNDDFFVGSKIFSKDVFSQNGRPIHWVVKKRRKYKEKLLSDQYMQMTAHRGADIFARRLILKKYNKYLPYRVRHYPKPMMRTVMNEIWNEFPEEVEKTLSGHFREADDLNISTFFSYYMIATNKAYPRKINGIRILLDFLIGRVHHVTATAGSKDFSKRLMQIKKQKPLTFCINDGEASSEHDRQIIRRYLSGLFPQKSMYEI